MPFSSKYRHVYGDVPKRDFWYQDVEKPYTSGEGRYVACNAKYWGVSKAGGGGPVYVHPIDTPGRLGGKLKYVNVHKGKALDFDFHPFIENIIGISSDDCMASVTQFADGMPDHVTDATVTLKGHLKKVHLMKWHPTANNIMCTSSWDRTVKLWNVENGECVQTYESLEQATFSMDYSQDGSLIACTAKDKKMRIFDPRVPDKDVMSFDCCEGSKSSKVFWIPNFNWIGCTSFNKQAKRQLKIWDMKDTSKEIFSWVIDQQSSVLMPKYDADTRMLFMHGKGDGSVFFNEMVNDKRIVYQLGMYRDTEPQKGGAFMPKRGLDTKKCEVMRYMRLTKNAVIPVSFLVPRKTGKDIFQADIYPDCKAGVPSMTADEYLGGDNKDPVMMSMDPDKRSDKDEEKDGGAAFVKKKSYAELSAENEELKAKIEELENQLSAM